MIWGKHSTNNENMKQYSYIYKHANAFWKYLLLMCDSYETFGDTKGIIRSRKTKNRQYNGQKTQPPTNNDLQITTPKPKD